MVYITDEAKDNDVDVEAEHQSLPDPLGMSRKIIVDSDSKWNTVFHGATASSTYCPPEGEDAVDVSVYIYGEVGEPPIMADVVLDRKKIGEKMKNLLREVWTMTTTMMMMMMM